MDCPYCNNEVPLGATHCPSCGGSIPNNTPASIPMSPVTTSISTTYAWSLALLPLLVLGLLSVLIGMLPDDASDETYGAFGLLAVILCFVANLCILRKDEKLLGEKHLRDEMLVFMRIGIFVPQVYLCARAAKIDKNWAYAIVSLLIGIVGLWLFVSD